MELSSNRSIKICFVLWDYWPGSTGGAEMQALRLCNEINTLGHQAWILTRKQKKGHYAFPEGVEHPPVVRIPCLANLADFFLPFTSSYREKKGGLLRLTAIPFRMLLGYLQKKLFVLRAQRYLYKHQNNFDILHLPKLSWLSAWAGYQGTKLKKPALAVLPTNPSGSETSLATFNIKHPRGIPNFKKIHPYLWKLDGFIAKTEDLTKNIKATCPPGTLIKTIPNGVNIPLKQAAPPCTDRLIVLYVGTLACPEWKATDIIIKAWVQVSLSCPNARLIMVGKGDPTKYASYLEKENCHTVSFPGQQTDLAPYYSQASIFLLPSRQEGMSNALLEAQSYGIPAIVSDIPGNTAIVEERKNGFVVPVGDTQQLADRIISLINSPEYRKRMQVMAVKKITQNYSMSKIACEMINFYRMLIEK